MNDKIAADVCEKEFLRMCAARRIKTDVASMTKENQDAFQEKKADILEAMADRSLIVNGDGNPEYTLPGGQKLTFYQVTGAILMAQDGFGPTDTIARLLSIATALTKSAPGALAKLELTEFGVVSDLTNFLTRRW